MSDKPIAFNEGWNEHRWNQVFDLEQLINEITLINHGSNALGRIERIIKLAKTLDHDRNMGENHLSLARYLIEMAVQRESGQENKEQ